MVTRSNGYYSTPDGYLKSAGLASLPTMHVGTSASDSAAISTIKKIASFLDDVCLKLLWIDMRIIGAIGVDYSDPETSFEDFTHCVRSTISITDDKCRDFAFAQLSDHKRQ